MSGFEKRQRWTLVGPFQILDTRLGSGPRLKEGEKVEVMPVSEHEATLVELRELAEDVLSLAEDGGMPDSYFSLDPRVLRAKEILAEVPEA